MGVDRTKWRETFEQETDWKNYSAAPWAISYAKGSISHRIEPRIWGQNKIHAELVPGNSTDP